MNFEIVRACDLTSELLCQWAKVQESNKDFASPYFRPEFTQTVAAVRNDVFVCLLREGNRIAGFFPFHRSHGKVGRPIGLGLSDYHGVVADADARWTVEELLRACGIVRWDFDHLLASQSQFKQFHEETFLSPIIDVSNGFDAFTTSRDKSGRKQLREVERKRKKMEADLAPVRFTEHTDDLSTLNQLIQWKSFQCRRTGTVDYFALEWCVQLIERIHSYRCDDFGGILSTLHVGDTLAAAHFAMYSRDVWHSWFPVYNDEMQKYSPGFILLIDMIKSATMQHVRYIDLGKGLSLYKKRVATGGIQVASGRAELPSLRNQARRLLEGVERWSRQSALKPIFRHPGRIIKRIEKKKRYE